MVVRDFRNRGTLKERYAKVQKEVADLREKLDKLERKEMDLRYRCLEIDLVQTTYKGVPLAFAPIPGSDPHKPEHRIVDNHMVYGRCCVAVRNGRKYKVHFYEGSRRVATLHNLQKKVVLEHAGKFIVDDQRPQFKS
jgi:hypothetical protein